MSREKQIEEMAVIVSNSIREWANELPPISNPHFVATALYNAGYRKQEWISVDERLPENDWGKHWKERKYYLVLTEPSGLMDVATYGYKEYGWWVDRHHCVLDEKSCKRVTHWMPLPEAPKKGGAE